MIRVGIVGASGYTGRELLRLLKSHPEAKVEYLASRTKAGEPVVQEHPSLRGCGEWSYEPLDIAAMVERCDVVFTAVPHGAAMELAPQVVQAGRRLIDLGTDFRFRDHQTYEQWYGITHTQPELTQRAVYGLPELFRAGIKGANLVGNPGCYPTSALLALAPLIKAGVPMQQVVITSMSGVSGAGITPKPMYHFPDCTENVQAYGTVTHRHTPEIEQGIRLLGGSEVSVLFTPHLVPMSRGILSTVICKSDSGAYSTAGLCELYTEFYRHEPFVHVLGTDSLPQTKAVWGSNFCHVSVRYDKRTGYIVAQAAIDNLVKGASGQAIQNMNLLFDFDERTGLEAPGLMP